MATALTCVNPDCAKPVADGARFCPFCATEQREMDVPTLTPSPRPYRTVSSTITYSHGETTRLPAGETLLLRATTDIWHADDPEGSVAYDRTRPLVIVDEQVTHLAHTDKALPARELLERAHTALEAASVPVDVALRSVAWIRDPLQARPRLVASLRDHPYSDLKLLFGVDYLGRWASLQMHVAFQPEPLRAGVSGLLRFLGWLCLALSLFLPLLATVGLSLMSSALTYSQAESLEALRTWSFPLGFLCFVTGLVLLAVARNRERREEAERRARLSARMARTFAVDDMRLFASAMQEVFQTVVDDIVSQGGEVVRVTGGQGGFFEAAGLAQAVPERRSDAALASV